MTRDQAVARIKEGLHFRKGTTLDAPIKSRLEEARISLETGKSLPWFLKVEDDELLLPAGLDVIDLPEGFIRQDRFERLRYVNSSGAVQFIPWKSLDEAQLSYQEVDPGIPQVAVLRDTSIQFFPHALNDTALLWSYFAHSESLNAGDVADNPWLIYVPDAIVGEAGYRIAKNIGDASAMQDFDEMRKSGFLSIIGEDVERAAGEGPLVMGANN